MKIKKHADIAEVMSDDLLIETTSDALDVLGQVYYDGFDKMILHQTNLAPAFFDLQNGIAGDILQKFSNYRMRLAIAGDFVAVEKRSLREFIYECNQGQQVNFVATVEEAVERLSR